MQYFEYFDVALDLVTQDDGFCWNVEVNLLFMCWFVSWLWADVDVFMECVRARWIEVCVLLFMMHIEVYLFDELVCMLWLA